jgi:hypothetical protein
MVFPVTVPLMLVDPFPVDEIWIVPFSCDPVCCQDSANVPLNDPL